MPGFRYQAYNPEGKRCWVLPVSPRARRKATSPDEQVLSMLIEILAQSGDPKVAAPVVDPEVKSVIVDNDFTSDEEPICPCCRQLIVPDQGKTSGLYSNSSGRWIIHHSCVI